MSFKVKVLNLKNWPDGGVPDFDLLISSIQVLHWWSLGLRQPELTFHLLNRLAL